MLVGEEEDPGVWHHIWLQDKLQSEGGRWRSLLAAVMEDSKGFL
jgi:hypothetical protein